jgi:hypothetical protein
VRRTPIPVQKLDAGHATQDRTRGEAAVCV